MTLMFSVSLGEEPKENDQPNDFPSVSMESPSCLRLSHIICFSKQLWQIFFQQTDKISHQLRM